MILNTQEILEEYAIFFPRGRRETNITFLNKLTGYIREKLKLFTKRNFGAVSSFAEKIEYISFLNLIFSFNIFCQKKKKQVKIIKFNI